MPPTSSSILRSNSSSLWTALFGGLAPASPQPPKIRFTFEELSNLYAVLVRNPLVHEGNRGLVVETIRSVAEFILWGDQNEPKIFDFFLENNVMAYMHRLLLQPENRSGDVAKQVLQTLSIIVQNVRSQTAIFFLLSNNHLNNIVEVPFDFLDEEVMAYYISLLKTISLRLDAATVQFFLADAQPLPPAGQAAPAGAAAQRGQRLPLFTAAVRFADHPEGMVRAAVRALTLNILALRDPGILAFLTTAPSASHYFQALAAGLARHAAALARALQDSLAQQQPGGLAPQALDALDEQLADVEDDLAYYNDVLSTAASPQLAQAAAQQLWAGVVGPLLLQPLLPLCGRGAGSGQPNGSPPGPSEPPAAPAELDAAGQLVLGPPACALHLLERLFQLCSYQPLLHNLLFVLLDHDAAHLQPAAPDAAVDGGASSQAAAPSGDGSDGDAGGAGPSCRHALLSCLAGQQHPLLAMHCVRLLAAVLSNRHIQPRAAFMLGLMPKARFDILDAEAATSSSSNSSSAPLLPGPPLAGLCEAAVGPYRALYRTQFHQLLLPGPVAGNVQDAAARALTELADALAGLLHVQTLNVQALCQVGPLLQALAPPKDSGAGGSGQPACQLTAKQAALLEAALRAAQAQLVEQVSGMWADALLPLITLEWAQCRRCSSQLGGLRSSAEALTTGPHLYPHPHLHPLAGSAAAAAGNEAAAGLSNSGLAALRAYHAVQRAVGLAQVQQLLAAGSVPAEPPTQAVSEEQLRRHDVAEGRPLDLAGGWAAPCIVSFAPGQERRLHFGVAGLPVGRLQEYSPSKSSRQALEALLQTPPVAVLAELLPGRPASGRGVAMAPLMGCDPYADRQVPKWMHVHVRPSTRGLIRVLRASLTKRGGVLAALRHLADGHWVLAFPDAEQAALAVMAVDQHLAKLRGVYCHALEKLAVVPLGAGESQQRQQQLVAEGSASSLLPGEDQQQPLHRQATGSSLS